MILKKIAMPIHSFHSLTALTTRVGQLENPTKNNLKILVFPLLEKPLFEQRPPEPRRVAHRTRGGVIHHTGRYAGEKKKSEISGWLSSSKIYWLFLYILGPRAYRRLQKPKPGGKPSTNKHEAPPHIYY